MADRTVTVRLEAAITGYQAAMARAAASTQAVKAATTDVGREGARSLSTLDTAAASTSKSVGGLAGAVSPLTAGLAGGAGLVAGIGAVTNAAMDWETAFTGVKKTVSGTPEQLQAIGDGLREMSKEIPTSANDLAGIAESAGQLGIETDNILGFTRVIADLGETTNLAGEQGATELARFANITGMAQGDFDRLASTIVDLGNNFETTESEISTMALRIAGAGSQAGLTEADILGLSTALSSVGIEAEAGGSAISRTLTEISREVETNGDKLAIYAETAGVTVEEFKRLWGQDAAGALSTFVSGLADVKKEGGSVNGVLEELGITELRQADALRRLTGNHEGLAEALGRGEDAWRDNTAAADEAATKYETTQAKVDIAKNAVRDLAVTIGDDLLPILSDGATGLVEFFDAVPEQEWLTNGQTWGEALAEGVRMGFEDIDLIDPEEPPVVKVRPEMDFGEDGTWQVVDPFVVQVEPDWGEVGGWEEGLPSPVVTPEVDWSRIEAGTDVLDTIGQAAEEAVEPAEEAFAGLEQRVPDWRRIETGTGVMDGLATSFEDSGLAAEGAAGQYEVADEHLQNYLDTNRAAVDPMFALNDAYQSRIDAGRSYEDAQQAEIDGEQSLSDARHDATRASEDVTAAEAELREARKEGDAEAIAEAERNLEDRRRDAKDANRGVEESERDLSRTREEATESAWAVAEAQAELEALAVSGEISWDQFETRLASWVEQGDLTKAQADEMRERVKLLREEAEDYKGKYEAELEADTEAAYADIEATHKAAIAFRNDQYMAQFSADITNAEYGIERLREMLGALPTSVNIPVSASYSSQGELAVNIPGRGRLLVGTAQHGGGWAGTDGYPHDGMLRPDEIPTVLQDGEYVVAKGPARRNARALEAINAGREVTPSMAGSAATTSNDNRQDNRSVVIQSTGDPAADQWTAYAVLGMHG